MQSSLEPNVISFLTGASGREASSRIAEKRHHLQRKVSACDRGSKWQQELELLQRCQAGSHRRRWQDSRELAARNANLRVGATVVKFLHGGCRVNKRLLLWGPVFWNGVPEWTARVAWATLPYSVHVLHPVVCFPIYKNNLTFLTTEAQQVVELPYWLKLSNHILILQNQHTVNKAFEHLLYK